MNASTKAIVMIVAAVALSAGFSWWNGRPGNELVPWQSSITAARAESKPVLLYFTASWCGPCKWMSRNTFGDERVARALQAYTPVKIDIDANREAAHSYGISSVPTFILLTADGQAGRSTSGRMTPDEFIAWLGS